MKVSVTKTAAVFSFAAMMVIGAQSFAEDVYWITGDGNGTLIPTNYGTDVLPLEWTDTTKWFQDNARPNAGGQTLPNGGVPLDGQSVGFTNSCCNPEPFVSINNGGAGISLPNSTINFTNVKTNLLDSSAGTLDDIGNGSYDFNAVDDTLTADFIKFDGGGGQANDVYIPVVANTFRSTRHGARFYMPITVDTILAQSGHQDKWEIHVSPTGPIGNILLDGNRGQDGGSHDGDGFDFKADVEVSTELELVWQRMEVDENVTLTVNSFKVWDYTNNTAVEGGNPATNPNEVTLLGPMTAQSLTIVDEESGLETTQSNGVYGAIGSGAQFEVNWITGGSTDFLTVGPDCTPGDTDNDGDIDTADLTTSITNFTGAGGSTTKTCEEGDTDEDGDVDTADLTYSITNFTGAMAGNAGVPDLVYDPATGNVTIDADGADVISFSLQSGPFNAADFSELPAGLTDNIASQIGWTSFNLFSGLTGTANLGAILPAGLDQAGLEAALQTASYGLALAGGGGGGRLDLIIPEPASMVLMGLGAVALVRRRRAA